MSDKEIIKRYSSGRSGALSCEKVTA